MPVVDLLAELSVVDGRLRDESGLDAELRQTLEAQRAALRRRIPAPRLVAYDVLQRAGRHPPIATVVDGTCSGCNLQLPPQLANEVRYGTEPRSCPHCARMLCAGAGGVGRPGHAAKRNGK